MKRIKLIFLLIVFFVTSTAFAKQGDYEVHFLDTGQSDCILIKAEDKNYVIDTGAAYYTEKILKYLNDNNVNTIEGLVLTHYHDDHYDGLLKIVSEKRVNKVFLPIHDNELKYKFYKDLSEKGVKVKYIDNNYKLKYRKMHLTSIVPLVEDKKVENNNSVVLQGEIDGVRYVFAGDCEKSEEMYMLKRDLLKCCDVLKVPHHGLDTSCSDDFLEKLSPKIAVVTSNGVETPDMRIINRIYKKGIIVLRTDLQGNIVIKNHVLKTLKGDFNIKISKTLSH